MAINILTPGKDAMYSEEIVVGEDEQIVIALYTSNGSDCPNGVALRLQHRDINGNYMTVATPGYGPVFLGKNCQQILLTTPGTYRVYRPGSTHEGEVGVGVQQGL